MISCGVLPALVSSQIIQIHYFQRSLGPRHYKYNVSIALEHPDNANTILPALVRRPVVAIATFAAVFLTFGCCIFLTLGCGNFLTRGGCKFLTRGYCICLTRGGCNFFTCGGCNFLTRGACNSLARGGCNFLIRGSGSCLTFGGIAIC